MKHFLPSSVMLTPFVVRYYDEEEDDQEIVETKAKCSISIPKYKRATNGNIRLKES